MSVAPFGDTALACYTMPAWSARAIHERAGRSVWLTGRYRCPGAARASR